MNKKPPLVVDAQIFQTPAWDRGMGKYSIELLSALDKLIGQKKYWSGLEIILSRKIKFQSNVMDEIRHRLPGATITFLNLESNHYNNVIIAQKNRRFVDDHIKKIRSGQANKRIDFLILSLLQSEIAPAFPSGANIQKLLLIYDLIPLMFFETYLTDSTNRMVYLSKLPELMRADKYLTISETVANDLAGLIGISSHRIKNINGGPISHSEEYESFDVPKPFILMPTGNDLRKNNRRGIEGFELFNQRHDNKYHLVITSNFEKFQIDELNKISANLVFTGNISGSQLNFLYRESAGLLFPAEYEGLGLPILEALEHNKPVICSDISVFREISRSDFNLFDPLDTKRISQALENGLAKKPLVNREAYRRILKKYTWANTAESLYKAIIYSNPDWNRTKDYKLAAFIPDPAHSQSGLASQHLYAELQRKISIEYYIETQYSGQPTAVNYLPYATAAYDLTKRADIGLAKYDGLIFILENSQECGLILLAALAKRDALVLNDYDLTKLWQSMLDRNLINRARYEAEARLSKTYQKTGTAFLVSLIDRRRLVVVPSAEAKRRVEALVKALGTETRVVALGESKPDVVYPDTSQKNYGIEKYVNRLINTLKYQKKEV